MAPRRNATVLGGHARPTLRVVQSTPDSGAAADPAGFRPDRHIVVVQLSHPALGTVRRVVGPFADTGSAELFALENAYSHYLVVAVKLTDTGGSGTRGRPCVYRSRGRSRPRT